MPHILFIVPLRHCLARRSASIVFVHWKCRGRPLPPLDLPTMKQVLRKGFKDIVVDEVPDPIVTPHHVLVRPHYSLISSGTETASIHPDVLKEVAQNPSQLQKVLEVAKV